MALEGMQTAPQVWRERGESIPYFGHVIRNLKGTYRNG
jgi:hypothetical protein